MRNSGRSLTSVAVILVVAAAVIVGTWAVWRAGWTGAGGGLGPGFEYDLAALEKVDPALVRYQQVGSVPTGFEEARALAVGPDGRLYIAGDHSVRAFRLPFSGATQPAGEIKTDGEPHCLAVDKDGTIFIGVKDHVEVYDAAGERKASWESPGSAAVLTSIAVAGEDVFVADAGGRVVLCYDRQGRLVRRLGQKDPDKNIPGFVVPSPYFDLAVGSDGLLRVVNPGRHRIEAYTFDGDLEFSWGRFSAGNEGFIGCCNPVNFAILPDGRFVTAEKGVPRIKVYSAEGRFECFVARPAAFAVKRHICTLAEEQQCQTGGADVAADASGRVFVLDPQARTVLVFAPVKEVKTGP